MTEGLYVLLHTDKNLYASLFDFVEPWKIDILDYLNENYMCDLSMEEIASYTGRSLATFKRDFAKVSELTPQKWIIKRRLEAAHDLIKSGKKKVSEICFDVGIQEFVASPKCTSKFTVLLPLCKVSLKIKQIEPYSKAVTRFDLYLCNIKIKIDIR